MYSPGPAVYQFMPLRFSSPHRLNTGEKADSYFCLAKTSAEFELSYYY